MNLQQLLERAQERLRDHRLDEARSLLLRAASAAPSHPGPAAMLCYVLAQTGEHERSAYYGERAVAALPDAPDLRLNLAAAYMDLNRPDDAARHFEAACALSPDNALAHDHLIAALNHAGRFADADAAFDRAAEHCPSAPGLAARRADTLTALGRATEAVHVLADAIRRFPDEPTLRTDICSTLPYDPETPPDEALEHFKAYGEAARAALPQPAPSAARSFDPERPLLVGFLSPDLRSHAVATFLEPLLTHVDRERMRTVAYHHATYEDHVTARLRSAVDLWRAAPLRAMPDHIVHDAPDVLFDLSGHSAGHALPLFQLRLAPVQITWLGWPATTGVPAMDYRLTDSVADPVGAERIHTERLLRLDPCALCYQPHPDAPPPGVDDPKRPPTLGSFNAIAKLNDRVIALWAKILAEAPDARLVLKHTALAHEQGRDALRRRFANAGLDPERLTLLPPTGHVEHLRAYSMIDVALDPFPFNGATTTCDALRMGVPVITLPGVTSCSRVAASILSAAGREEDIAQDERQYIARATALLSDVGRLRAEQDQLRRQFLNAPICDGAAFARRFEHVVHQAWAERCTSA